MYCVLTGSKIGNVHRQQAAMKAMQHILQNMRDCLQRTKMSRLTQWNRRGCLHIVGNPHRTVCVLALVNVDTTYCKNVSTAGIFCHTETFCRCCCCCHCQIFALYVLFACIFWLSSSIAVAITVWYVIPAGLGSCYLSCETVYLCVSGTITVSVCLVYCSVWEVCCVWNLDICRSAL